jgi:hypothetical protein
VPAVEEPASVELTVTVGGDVVVEAVRDAHEAVWMHEPRGPRPPLLLGEVPQVMLAGVGNELFVALGGRTADAAVALDLQPGDRVVEAACGGGAWIALVRADELAMADRRTSRLHFQPSGASLVLAELPGLHETTRRQDGWAPYAPLEPRP